MQTEKPRIDALSVLEYFAIARVDETRRTLALADLVTKGRNTTAIPSGATNGAGRTPRTAGADEPERPSRPGIARGARHGSAKVNTDEVLRIRREYREPQTGRALAAELGISYTTIRSIAYRQTWKHLPAAPGDFAPANKTEPAKADQSQTADDAGAKADTVTDDGGEQRTTGLDPHEVHEIRREYLQMPMPAIARAHRVSETTIVGVANRVTWQSVERGPDEYVPPPGIEGTRLRRQPPLLPAPKAVRQGD